MIGGVHIEVLLTAGYAVFLGGVAVILELVARYSHRRAQQYEHAGFTYHRQMNLWECPAGERLLQTEIDHRLRVVRYRAPAKTCNACALKNNCTDSEEGREIERRLDSWIGSELQRFHRGLSLTLLLLAILILAAESLHHSLPRELALLLSTVGVLASAEIKLFKEFIEGRESSRGHTARAAR
jgi:hypothetical protein